MTRTLGIAMFVVFFAVAIAGAQPAVTPEAVDTAVRRGGDYLLQQQTKFGNWERTQVTPPMTGLGNGADDGQWGGRTALCTYALLAAGRPALDPKMARAVEWLRTAKITGTYAIGMRANVWFNLPQTAANKIAMEADARRLRSGGATVGTGLFDYRPGGFRTDLSCSQYGVLGSWAAAQRTGIFDARYWAEAETSWCDQQNDDGGWSYGGHGGGSTMQMTAAGVASLFITQELAHANDKPPDAIDAHRDPKVRYVAGNIDRGVAWIGQNLTEHLKNPLLYALYGIERVGVASGYKYLGDIDWYKTCAAVIVADQQKDGSWGGNFDPEVETAFALLFLSRGRAPVMVNKLQYDITAKRSATSRPSDWNLRPRDMANVTRWVEERTERHLNWQIVKLSVAPVDDLHDAPILYLSGRLPIGLKDDEKAKLKQYVEEGGLIIGSAEAGSAFFSRTFRTLGEELFPGEKFAVLDRDSILLSGEQFPQAGQKKPVTVEAIGNGARLLMILVPDGDLSAVYQRRDTAREAAYQFFANAFLYAVEKVDTRVKGQTHVVRPEPTTRPTKSAAIGRLQYDGRWDPEPGGWRRLAAVMHNTADTQLDVRTVRLGIDPLDGLAVAHLTGTAAFTLTDAQRDAIKRYVDTGGLILIDACGGNAAFAAAAEAELAKIDADFVPQLSTPLPPDCPLFTDADGNSVAPQYRPFALPVLGPLTKAFQLRGLYRNGKLAAIYSPQDLSEALVGQSVDGIIGYTPGAATAVVRRLIELRRDGKL